MPKFGSTSGIDGSIQYGLEYGQASSVLKNGTIKTTKLLLDQYSPVLAAGELSKGLVVVTHGSLANGSRSDLQTVNTAMKFAAAGYDVVAIDYRPTSRKESPIVAPEYAAFVLDQLALAEPQIDAGTVTPEQVRGLCTAAADLNTALGWLRAIDPDLVAGKVVLFGESSGASISVTYGYAADGYPEIGAADIDAVLDFSGLLVGPSQVDADDPALFIVHGTADPKVGFDEALALDAAARAAGLPVEFRPMVGVGHNTVSSLDRPTTPGGPILLDQILTFLDTVPATSDPPPLL